MKKNFILVFFMMLCSFAFSQNAGQTSYDWGKFDYHDYPVSKQVYAVINMDGNEVTNQNFEIAPFCGDQLRGKAAKPIFYGDNYGYIYTFSVFGNPGDEITFKLYDYATGTLYDNVAAEDMVWNDTPTGSIANPYTLHFTSVAEVENVKYGSLAKAIEEVAENGTVTIINDVNLSETLVVDKSFNLVNNYAVTNTTATSTLFRIVNGKTLTVEGSGTIKNEHHYTFTLGSSDETSAGNLIIKNGKYVGETTVASVTKGTLTIEGGEFQITDVDPKDYAYVINCIDANYKNGTAEVEIKGGKFYSFNPENNAAEGAGTDFCAEGYFAVETSENVYEVVEGLIGKGTETEPFLIRSLNELKFFRDHVNAGKTKYNAEGVHVALAANIDMATEDWSNNIGDDCNYTFDGIFNGSYNGVQYTLSNLNSTETAQKADGYICTGLFGAIAGNAVVKNLTIENVNIEAEYAGNNVAAVVGFAYTIANKTATIENVTVKGNISINAPKAYAVGTIVGYSYEPGNINITSCAVEAKEGSAITAVSGSGAIIGHAAGIVTVKSSSVNNIDITAKGLVGGLAGFVSSSKSVLDNNTVKNVNLTAKEANWVNSAAIAVGTMNKDGLTVANTTFENVNASQMVGSVYANKPTSVVPAVEARIGNVYYTTFDNAKTASQQGNTITVLNQVVVTEDTTYNLTGINVEGDVYPMFRIQNGATVTFEGGNFTNGDYVFTLGEGATDEATSGNLVINGGTYVGETTVANVVKGLLTINGGEFSLSAAYQDNYNFLINCYDATYKNDLANVEIKGGTFYGFNPENNAAEGEGTNFCAAGYSAVETGSDIWTVVPRQSQEIAAGWNWFSSYINISGAEGLTALENALGNSATTIKSNLGFVEYAGNNVWYGDGGLTSVSVADMYMINTIEDAEIQLLGELADPSTEITIKKGWNWIGYPVSESTNYETALADLASKAKLGDRIKSRNNGYLEFYENANTGFKGWAGELESFVPGQGYMYYSNSDDQFTFTYSVSASKEEVRANMTTEGNYWVANGASFANNMTMTAVLNVNGVEMTDNYEVAAFAGEEVRGSARPVYVESIDRYVMFMTIYGEGNEELTFKYIDLDTYEVHNLNDMVVYADNAMLGSLRKPMELCYGTMGIGENGFDTMSLYPNPTRTGRTISLEAICDMVEVFNSLGVKVAEYRNVETIDGIEEAGVYVIRVTNGETVKNCRLIVR